MVDYSKITLLPEEIAVLKALDKHSPRNVVVAERAAAGTLARKFHFADELDTYRFSITKEGQRYMAYYREDRYRHHRPVQLSKWALAVSVVSFLASVAALLLSLFR